MYLGLKLLPSQLAMMGLNEKDSIVSRLEHLCTMYINYINIIIILLLEKLVTSPPALEPKIMTK